MSNYDDQRHRGEMLRIDLLNLWCEINKILMTGTPPDKHAALMTIARRIETALNRDTELTEKDTRHANR